LAKRQLSFQLSNDGPRDYDLIFVSQGPPATGAASSVLLAGLCGCGVADGINYFARNEPLDFDFATAEFTQNLDAMLPRYALAFAREGARIVIAGRRDEAGDKLVAELRALGARPNIGVPMCATTKISATWSTRPSLTLGAWMWL